MTAAIRLRSVAPAALVIAGACLLSDTASAQRGRGSSGGAASEAAELDRNGEGARAREIYQRLIDSARDPASRAQAERQMAMSYAFDGDCANTLRYEQRVIDYWKTREADEPQNAFYQEGEMADEGARVCVDAGDLDLGEQWYRLGHTLGTREPEPRTHPNSLWAFRLAHALGRIAARRGDRAEAERQIAAARLALDRDPDMAAEQERFFPYLTGYVALYLGDLARAEADLTKALSLVGNQRDPFMHCLLAMAFERQGRQTEAQAMYQKAFDLAEAHNPPAAFVRRVARQKLGPLDSDVEALRPQPPAPLRSPNSR